MDGWKYLGTFSAKNDREREKVCPPVVTKMLLAEILETIDILADMLKI